VQIKIIKNALNNNKRVYAVFTTGLYKGQITSIKTMKDYKRQLQYGNLKLHKITTVKDTLKQMIKRA